MFDFPPFSRLVRLVFRSPNLEDSKSTACNAKQILENKLDEFKKKFSEQAEDVEILGESECPLQKISSNYRYQILLKSKNISILQQLVSHLIYDFTHPNNVYIEIDIDPINLL